MSIILHINGRDEEVRATAADSLRDALRDAGYVSVRFGSHSGETGAAAVLLDGRLVSADTLLVGQAVSHTLETIEGLSPGVGALHPIQQAFIQTGAVQCGYCIPGFLMSGAMLLEEQAAPEQTHIEQAFAGNLCRCTGYYKIIEAVHVAAGEMN